MSFFYCSTVVPANAVRLLFGVYLQTDNDTAFNLHFKKGLSSSDNMRVYAVFLRHVGFTATLLLNVLKARLCSAHCVLSQVDFSLFLI